MRFKKGFNPFYVLLVVVGTTFCLTACAYGLMAMRSLRPERNVAASATDQSAARPGPHQLMAFMQRNGERLLFVEVAVLAVAALAAMGTDGYWTRRAAEKDQARREAAKSKEPTL